MVWFLIRSIILWPFVLQFSSSPFALIFVSLLMGALIKWSRWWWPRGIFIFYSVLLLVKSISLTSRHDFASLFGCPHLGEADFVGFEVLIYFLQCSFCHEVDFVDLEARVFACFSCRVSSFWWSRSCWPRGTNLFFTVHFLRWSRSFWPWGTNFAVLFLQWSRSHWPWGTNLILAVLFL